MTRRSLTEFALANPLYVWLVVLACMVGGVLGVQSIARLEDPPYPIKMAYVFVEYPGASAVEVELEVTEVVERSLQELPWVKKLVSRSLPGRSEIEVELKMSVALADAPQIWDELRRRVSEAAMQLPPQASPPLVEDDFIDVYGLLYAVSIPEGYPISAVNDAARLLQTELKRVPHVGKVRVDGVPKEQVNLDINYEQLRRLGIPFERVVAAVNGASDLFPASDMLSAGRRLRIDQPLTRDERALAEQFISSKADGTLLRLADLAQFSRTEVDQPPLIIRHQGQRVFTVGVSIDQTQNVVRVGQAVERRLGELQSLLPAGMELRPLFEQHHVVDQAIDTFLVNLAASVSTVIGALCLFMGWRAGFMVGAVLLVTVFGTIALMATAGIELQRISLGAMMIAMGMLVDNAIVVAEGMVTGIRTGQSPRDAAIDTVQTTRMPLLAATVIGVAAFAPIGLSADSTGQFLGSLFTVCGISLLLSWLLAITLIPSLGLWLLPPTSDAQEEASLYGGPIFSTYRWLICLGIRRRLWACLLLLGIMTASFVGFGQLRQGFFPATSTPLFFVDLYLPQGSDIATSDALAETVRKQVETLDGVVEVSTWVGRGPMRFTMILLPERPDPAYAQLVIRVDDVQRMDAIMSAVDAFMWEQHSGIAHMVRRMEFTTGTATKVEARFFGPDRAVLRDLAEQAMAVYIEHGLRDRRIDWREQRLALSVTPDAARARLAGIDTLNVAQSLQANTVGSRIGTLRDDDQAVPIVARVVPFAHSAQELVQRDLWSERAQAFIPAEQVVRQVALAFEDSFIMRRDRTRVITVQGNASGGQETTGAFNRIRPDIEAIPLPPGYRLDWGGEYEAMQTANDSVVARFPIALLVMVFATLLLFGSIRQTLVIWLTVPLTMTGVFLGLQAANLSFTFPALLGLLSLIGILIKNCVILVEEVNLRTRRVSLTVPVLVAACVSRLRPVLLAGATTVVGMAPLLRDDFFREMAVSIMGGLAFGSVLALVAVPVYYAVFFRVPEH